MILIYNTIYIKISRNSKIKYLDGSGEDVTPVPLFVPPEPEEEEKGEEAARLGCQVHVRCT